MQHRAAGDETLSLLSVTGLKKSFYDGSSVLEVLKSIDLSVQAGESIAIMGASGAGKSTLLHLIGALDRPTAGEIVLDGVSFKSLSSRQLADVRNSRIGFIFQFHHLLPEFTAHENVFMPALINTTKYGDFNKISDKARSLLDQVGLTERLNHRPAKLSGGEQQRVALCRALMNDPLLVLADEPTGDLDLTTGDEMIKVIWRNTVEQNRTLIIVTHNPDIALRADRIFHLQFGSLHLMQKDLKSFVHPA